MDIGVQKTNCIGAIAMQPQLLRNFHQIGGVLKNTWHIGLFLWQKTHDIIASLVLNIDQTCKIGFAFKLWRVIYIFQWNMIFILYLQACVIPFQ